MTGSPGAEIAGFVGQRKLSITTDTYSHVMSDGQELDYGKVLRWRAARLTTRRGREFGGRVRVPRRR